MPGAGLQPELPAHTETNQKEPIMRRLGVLRPIQSIEEVQASIDTFGDRIADGMDARRVPPDDGGGPRFSYRDVVDDLGQNLEPMRQKVVAAEDEHVRRLAHAAALRRQGEELGTELYDQQVMARRILGGAYPKRGFELAAVSGTTPRNYKPLQEQVDQTVKLLREPVAELPPVKLSGVEITPVEVADGLQLSLDGFREVRTDYGRARKAVGESKVDLDRTLDEFRATFPWIAQSLEGFARLVGERELADRIRTSIRRVTRRQAEGEEDSSEQASAEETSPEETSSSTETSETASESTES